MNICGFLWTPEVWRSTIPARMNPIKITTTLCAASWRSIMPPGWRRSWSSDFEASKKQAAEAKKDLLIDFTGSDWCGWCIKLNKEVFSLEPFKAGVKNLRAR